MSKQNLQKKRKPTRVEELAARKLVEQNLANHERIMRDERRDRFAAAALTGLLAADTRNVMPNGDVAAEAYDLADAMLARREVIIEWLGSAEALRGERLGRLSMEQEADRLKATCDDLRARLSECLCALTDAAADLRKRDPERAATIDALIAKHHAEAQP